MVEIGQTPAMILLGLACIYVYRRDPKATNAGVTHGLGWVTLGIGVLFLILGIALWIVHGYFPDA